MTAITEAGRKEEAAKLRELKPRVRHFIGFGDDNRAAILVQIHVLEQDLSHEDIDDRYGNMPDHIYNSAQHARKWADGEDDLAPHENWQHFVKG